MSTLPIGFAQLTLAFAFFYSKPVFKSVQVVLFDAILVIGNSTVTSVLRVIGVDREAHVQTYHRGLNRAACSPLAASRIFLWHLVRVFAPHGPLIFGLDATIKRRWGARIATRGIYGDPVRSSRSHLVKFSDARPVPVAQRQAGLCFLAVGRGNSLIGQLHHACRLSCLLHDLELLCLQVLDEDGKVGMADALVVRARARETDRRTWPRPDFIARFARNLRKIAGLEPGSQQLLPDKVRCHRQSQQQTDK